MTLQLNQRPSAWHSETLKKVSNRWTISYAENIAKERLDENWGLITVRNPSSTSTKPSILGFRSGVAVMRSIQLSPRL